MSIGKETDQGKFASDTSTTTRTTTVLDDKTEFSANIICVTKVVEGSIVEECKPSETSSTTSRTFENDTSPKPNIFRDIPSPLFSLSQLRLSIENCIERNYTRKNCFIGKLFDKNEELSSIINCPFTACPYDPDKPSSKKPLSLFDLSFLSTASPLGLGPFSKDYEKSSRNFSTTTLKTTSADSEKETFSNINDPLQCKYYNCINRYFENLK